MSDANENFIYRSVRLRVLSSESELKIGNKGIDTFFIYSAINLNGLDMNEEL